MLRNAVEHLTVHTAAAATLAAHLELRVHEATLNKGAEALVAAHVVRVEQLSQDGLNLLVDVVESRIGGQWGAIAALRGRVWRASLAGGVVVVMRQVWDRRGDSGSVVRGSVEGRGRSVGW